MYRLHATHKQILGVKMRIPTSSTKITDDLLGARRDAAVYKDLIQTTFLKKRIRYDAGENFLTWMFAMLIRVHKKKSRRRKKRLATRIMCASSHHSASTNFYVRNLFI